MASSRKIVAWTAVVGLATAALTFGAQVLGMWDNKPADVGQSTAIAPVAATTTDASGLPVTVSPQSMNVPSHTAVTHYDGGTGAMLSGGDDVIISDEMMSKPVGSFNNGAGQTGEDALQRIGYDHLNPFCSPTEVRIVNATRQSVSIRVALHESEYFADITIGPGQRWASTISDPGFYVVHDLEERWIRDVQITDCSSGSNVE